VSESRDKVLEKYPDGDTINCMTDNFENLKNV